MKLPELAGDVAERLDGILQKRGRYVQQLHVLGEMNKTIAVDIDAARRDLGYEPAVELYDGMRRSIRWCIEQGINCERHPIVTNYLVTGRQRILRFARSSPASPRPATASACST